ncbi:MAG: hypothetical protein M3140_05285 [Actinomycetota bacterium]|nr:hypothetical protein [Actinomycetota bacterium]
MWFSLSMFMTLTVAPGLTEAGVVYLKFMIMISAFATGFADEADDDVPAGADVAAEDTAEDAEPPPALPVDLLPDEPQAAIVPSATTPTERPRPIRLSEPGRERGESDSRSSWLRGFDSATMAS